MQGRCPECGLEFAWASLLSDVLVPPVWHVEHPVGRMLRRTPGMLRRSMLPSRFWRACDIERLRRPRRAAGYLITGFAAVMLAVGGARALLSVSLIWATGLGAWGRQPAMGVYAADDWFSVGTSVLNMLVPLRVVEFEVRHRFVSGTWVPTGIDAAEFAWVTLPGVAVIPLTTAAVYVVLPWTLGAARVRAAQIFRVLCYGAPVWLLVVEAAMLAWWAVVAAGWWRLELALVTLGLAVAVLWQQWSWWLAVNRDFLRLDRPRAVTAAMVTISWLAGLVVVVGFSETVPQLLQNVM